MAPKHFSARCPLCCAADDCTAHPAFSDHYCLNRPAGLHRSVLTQRPLPAQGLTAGSVFAEGSALGRRLLDSKDDTPTVPTVPVPENDDDTEDKKSTVPTTPIPVPENDDDDSQDSKDAKNHQHEKVQLQACPISAVIACIASAACCHICVPLSAPAATLHQSCSHLTPLSHLVVMHN